MMSKENLKVNKPKDDRARNWAIIAYPESAPENWLEILKSQCSKFSISPANSDLKEHYNYAFNHTIHYRAYLQSRRHKNESK